MEENVDSPETERRSRRTATPLLLVVLVVALAAVGWLAAQRFLTPGPPAPAPAPAATPESEPTATPPEEKQATPTSTQVLLEASASPTPKPTATETAPVVVEELAAEPIISERVRNGSFEAGFEDHRVGLGWTSFNNGSAVFDFLDETWSPAVLDGEHAQRIQVREASQPDRYAGIYQTVNVIPGETYELSLHGQIRSGEGDIKASQYGYRLQLGIDYEGGQDWTAVDKWVELPWDEQRFDSDFLFFYEYVTPIVATGPRITLFIRAWNKWADPGQVEYTLDAISLIGLASSEALAFDEPLPVTGDAPLTISGWVRILASVVVLCLLVAGAAWQLRRQIS